jgi:endonuclease-8
MPEGDTIHRTAATLHRWLAGRTITTARSREVAFDARSMVGDSVEAVGARGKHLLVHLASGRVVHTHQGMHGSWHVYRTGERWQRPPGHAKLIIETGERVAVCFESPVVELLSATAFRRHPVLIELGPDLLDPSVDIAEILRRATSLARRSIGELLLDQRVVAGIGNVYRSEVLWDHRVHPLTAVGALAPEQLEALVATASEMLRRNVNPAAPPSRRFGVAEPRVYRRTGRPCPRCATPIVSALLGSQPRRAYWCPQCQPAPAGGPGQAVGGGVGSGRAASGEALSGG